VEKLKLSEVLEKLWTCLTVDFITKLLLVARKSVILIVCDMLSKITHFITTMEGTSAERLVRLFKNNMLQIQNLRVSQEKEPYIRINTRELNRELCIR